MRLPMKDGKIDEVRAIGQVRTAIDKGVNYLDTAWPYHGGESEPFVGKVIRDGYREKVRIATKLPSWQINSREDMDRFLNAQLKKLGVDHIDYYLLHSLDGRLWDTVRGHGALEFLDQAKKDGRIVNAGFSYHGMPEDFKRIIDAYPWVFCQIQYNYMDEHIQAGTAGLKYAASKDIGVIVMEPLRGGNLGRPTQPPTIMELWNGAKTRRSSAEWALRWVWNHPEVTVVLSGMNDESQIEENLTVAGSAIAGNLSDEEVRLVEQVSGKYREMIKVGCTGCGYCMPCPANVTIPWCFEEYNNLYMFGDRESAKFTYAIRMGGGPANNKPGFASQCVRCGACLKKCPQHIPIPDMLEKVAAEMEGPELQGRLAAIRQMFSIKPE
jgi:predicted aldo/keto reductase-like oxidoreductase